MTTTETITITAETIQQLVGLREVAKANIEANGNDVNKAILNTLESTMRLIGITWEQEVTDEEKDERAEKFAEELEAMETGERKTGLLAADRNMHQYRICEQHKCECLGAGTVRMHWYIGRDKAHTPTIRVDWYFPTEAKRLVRKNGMEWRKMTWACTEREQKFPFTEKGYEAACALFDSLMAE